MEAYFTKLHIAGFKSFADSSSIDILPGLTGIIGPNGCGKSNIVEALRWVMGESSARSLRGGEMDDVIFAGTANRSSRNIAEVSLSIENAAGLAPAPYRELPELQITRRIERNSGSTYYLNNKVQRARDIQTLFADMAAGARSSAMVSQGKVATLVSAKPEERRIILEEAAGITGLHTRRKEAEQKLHAAETNLERVQDRLDQLAVQQTTLSEQSEQAAHYRQLSEILHLTQEQLLLTTLKKNHEQVLSTRDALHKAREELQKLEQNQTGLRQMEEDQTQSLNAQKQALDQQRTEMEALRLNLESLLYEERAAIKAVETAQQHLQHLYDNRLAAYHRYEEAQNKVKTQQEEYKTLQTQLTLLEDEHTRIVQKKAECLQAFKEAEAQHQTTQAALTEALKTHEALQRKISENNTLKERLNHRLKVLQQELSASEALIPDPISIEELERNIEELHQQLNHLEQDKNALTRSETDASLAFSKAENHLAHVKKEHETLQKNSDEQTRLYAALTQELNQLHAKAKTYAAEEEALRQQDVTDEQLQQAEETFNTSALHLEESQNTLRQATEKRQKCADQLQLLKNSHQGAQQNYQQAVRHREALHDQYLKLTDTLALSRTQHVPAEQLESTHTTLLTIRDQVELQQKHQEELQLQAEHHTHILHQAQAEIKDIHTELERLNAQRQGLQAALSSDVAHTYTPIVEHVEITEGFEEALAAGLAEGLEAGDNTDTATCWFTFATLPAPPFSDSTLKPLSSFIKAPAALQRALNAIAVAENTDQAHALAPTLTMGQSIVTRDGGLWRWDGYHIKPGSPSITARKLAQRQKITALNHRIEQLENTLPEKIQHENTLKERAGESTQLLEAVHETLKKLRIQLTEAQQTFATLEQRHMAALARTEAIIPQYEQLQKQLAQAQQEEETAHTQYLHLDPLDIHEDALHKAQQEEETARLQEGQAREQRKINEEQWLTMRRQGDAQRQQREKIVMHQQTLTMQINHNVAEQERIQKIIEEMITQKHALPAIDTLSENLEKAALRLKEAQKMLQEHVQIIEEHKNSYEGKRKELQHLQQAQAEHSSKLSVLKPRFEEAQAEYTALMAEMDNTQDVGTLTAHLQQCQENHEQAQSDLATVQQTLNESEEALRKLQTNREVTQARVQTLLKEQKEGSNRVTDLHNEHAQADRLYQQAQAELELLKQHPIQKQALYQEARDTLVQNEEAYGQAHQALLTLQQQYDESSRKHQKTAELLGGLRENIVRLESRHEQAQTNLAQLYSEHPHLSTYPLQDFTPQESEAILKARIHSAESERDSLGPVNLRAELESQTVTEQMDTLSRESRDLSEAITKLRSSIAELNNEGRERLKVVFDKVNTNFQDLFTRMFGGGKAYLALVGDSDPLIAGLEIFAQPPGKKLSSLSLLSGGEQALTAISLIFAIFHCTPAPICVLDEVDAPLDDANIQRFCNLLADMVTQTGTRFLVVTHHQLTMAHMDRLYGITMQERGISRVLSVDFNKAVSMVEKV